MTDRIPSKFASGGDNTPIDLTDATGKVNWDQGYTPDYERKIGDDANAKAVERAKQNWLFGVLTDNVKQWQDQAFPEWRGTAAGTTGIPYPKNAVVRFMADGNVYRAIQAVPANTLPTNTDYWNVLPTTQQIIAISPMPAGGGDPTKEIISSSVGVNVDTFPSGTWEFTLNAAASLGLPEAVAGTLESKAWKADPANPNRTSATQRYQTFNGRSWFRSNDGLGWTTWRRVAERQELANRGYFDGPRLVNDDLNNAVDTGFYTFGGNPLNRPADFPAATVGYVQVIKDPSGVSLTQVVTADGDVAGQTVIWTRSRYNTTWRPWRSAADIARIPSPARMANTSTPVNFDDFTPQTVFLDDVGFGASTGTKPAGAISGGVLTTQTRTQDYVTQMYHACNTGAVYFRTKYGTSITPWAQPIAKQSSLGGYGIRDALANAKSSNDNLFIDDQFMDSRWTLSHNYPGLSWSISDTGRHNWPGSRLITFSGDATVPASSGTEVYMPDELNAIPIRIVPKGALAGQRQALDIGYSYSLGVGAIGRVGMAIGFLRAPASGANVLEWRYYATPNDAPRGTSGLQYTNRVIAPEDCVLIYVRIGVYAQEGGTRISGVLNIGAPFIRQASGGDIAGYLSDPAGYNFNDLIRSGMYIGTNDTAMVNSTNRPPTGAAGTLHVVNTEVNVITQLFIDRNGVIFGRGCNSGTWTAWRQTITYQDVESRGFPNAVIIPPSGTSPNNYTAQGIYHQSTDAGAAANSMPAGLAGVLEVQTLGAAQSDQVFQRYTTLAFRSDPNRLTVYERAFYSGEWSPWVAISTMASGYGPNAPATRPDGSPWKEGDIYFTT